MEEPLVARTVVEPPGPPGPPPLEPALPPEEGRDLDRALAIGLILFLVLVAAGIAAAILLTRHGKHHAQQGTHSSATPTAPLATTGRVVGSTGSSRTVPVVAHGPGTKTSRTGTSAPPATGVPDVVGLSASDAAAKLSGAGFRPSSRKAASSRPAGTVLSESPAAGAKLVKGDRVLLVVAQPVPKATVPNLVGEKRLAALTDLRRAGLGKRVHLVPAGSRQPGLVIAQFPKAGTVVPRGRPVRINVGVAASTGGGGGGGGTTPTRTTPATTTSPGTTTASGTDVPDVTSLDEQQATTRLQNAGFQVDSTDRTVTDQSEDGTVLDQRPAGGTRAPGGSTVTIVVGRYSGG